MIDNMNQIPFPNTRPLAPAAPVVTKRCSCPRASIGAFRVCRRCGGEYGPLTSQASSEYELSEAQRRRELAAAADIG